MFKLDRQCLDRHGHRDSRNRSRRVQSIVSAALAIAATTSLTFLSKPPTAAASPLPSSWKLTFNSNFSGTSVKGKPNPKVWTTCYPWAPSSGCTNYSNANAEQEWYQSSQVVVSGGVLHLVAKRAATKGTNAQGKPKEYSCRSGMVTTYKGFKFKYGFVQVTARLPFTTGMWPAFWLAAANEKYPPEIDILEHWGDASLSKLYLHPLSGVRQGAVYKAPTADTGWHTWRLYWTKSRLTWYYDGRATYTTTKGVPQQAMYFIADLADTNNVAAKTDKPGGTCNNTLLIQSVKVWQP